MLTFSVENCGQENYGYGRTISYSFCPQAKIGWVLGVYILAEDGKVTLQVNLFFKGSWSMFHP